MMDNIANINTSPSSGYPKEEMMDNITNINTTPSSGYPKEEIKVITKLPNSEQSYKRKVKTHNYINRQNQSTTGKL